MKDWTSGLPEPIIRLISSFRAAFNFVSTVALSAASVMALGAIRTAPGRSGTIGSGRMGLNDMVGRRVTTGCGGIATYPSAKRRLETPRQAGKPSGGTRGDSIADA